MLTRISTTKEHLALPMPSIDVTFLNDRSHLMGRAQPIHGNFMASEMENRIENLSSLVGNTPLLEIYFKYRGEARVLYAKAEYFNLSGSIKDERSRS